MSTISTSTDSKLDNLGLSVTSRRNQILFYLSKALNLAHLLRSDSLQKSFLDALKQSATDSELLHKNLDEIKFLQNEKLNNEKLLEQEQNEANDYRLKVERLEHKISDYVQEINSLNSQLQVQKSNPEKHEDAVSQNRLRGSLDTVSSPSKTPKANKDEKATRLHLIIANLKKALKEKDAEVLNLQSHVSSKESELDRFKIKLETEESNWKVRLQVLESKLATQDRKLRMQKKSTERKSLLVSPRVSSPKLFSPSKQAIMGTRQPNATSGSPLSVTPFLQKTSTSIGLSSSPPQSSPSAQSSQPFSRDKYPHSMTVSPSNARYLKKHLDDTIPSNVSDINHNDHLKIPQSPSSLSPSKIPIRKKRKLKDTVSNCEFTEEDSESSFLLETIQPSKSTLRRSISPLKKRNDEINELKKGFTMKK
ncbi:Monopolin complex subunit mde4 [Schizosaccharomyces pombe]